MTELYASALHLDLKAIKELKIKDPYSLHRVIYSLFADVRDEQQKQSHIPSGIIYADQGGDRYGRKVLMLSDRAPAQQINDQYGQVISKVVSESFLDYSNYRFQVQINPVRRDNKTKKLIAIKGKTDVLDWFVQRAQASWGFKVDPSTLQVDKIEVQQFLDKKGRTITLGKAHIQGALIVTEPEKFKQSFRNGIGKGRAFGCGLLQIVPLLDTPFA